MTPTNGKSKIQTTNRSFSGAYSSSLFFQSTISYKKSSLFPQMDCYCPDKSTIFGRKPMALLSGPQFVCLQPLDIGLQSVLKKKLNSDFKQQLFLSNGRDSRSHQRSPQINRGRSPSCETYVVITPRRAGAPPTNELAVQHVSDISELGDIQILNPHQFLNGHRVW